MCLHCRWVCKYYDAQKPSILKTNKGKRKNQAILPCDCQMAILFSYSRILILYVVITAKLHSHLAGNVEYSLYITE